MKPHRLFLAALLLTLAASTAHAAFWDTSGARYTSRLVAINQGADRTDTGVPFNISSAALVDGNFVASDALNSLLQAAGSVDANALDNGSFENALTEWTETASAGHTVTFASSGAEVKYGAASGQLDITDAADVEGRNFVVDSSFERSDSPLADWTADSGTATYTQDTSQAKFGDASLKVVMTNGGGNFLDQETSSGSFVAGDSVSLSVWYHIEALSGNNPRLLATIEFLNSGGSILAGHNTSELNSLTSDFSLASILNKTAPANTDRVRIRLRALGTASAGNLTGYFDGVLLVKSASIPAQWHAYAPPSSLDQTVTVTAGQEWEFGTWVNVTDKSAGNTEYAYAWVEWLNSSGTVLSGFFLDERGYDDDYWRMTIKRATAPSGATQARFRLQGTVSAASQTMTVHYDGAWACNVALGPCTGKTHMPGTSRLAMTGAVAYDEGTTTFTDQTAAANNATTGDMTLLPADPVVNDAYYFGGAHPWRILTLSVSQASLSELTLAWEYWDGSQWLPLANVVDRTDAFTRASQNTVSWDMPHDWETTAVDSITAYWVRARVDTVTTSVALAALGSRAFWETGQWWAFTESLPANVQREWTAYYGGSTDIPWDHLYFPGAAGITTPDNGDLEIGSDEFSLTLRGWVDTSAQDTNLVYKRRAFVLGIGENGLLRAKVGLASGDTDIPRLPNADVSTEIPSQTGCAASEHFDCLNDPVGSPDDDTSYLATTSSSFERDVYTLVPPDCPDLVTSVTSATVRMRRTGGSGTAVAQLSLIYNGQTTASSTLSVDSSSYTNTNAAALAKPGGGDWTCSDFRDTQLALDFRCNACTEARITQLYITIRFQSGVTVEVPAVPAGLHTVTVAREGADLNLYLDGVLEDTDTAVTMGDTANNWGWVQDGSMTWMDHIQYVVDDVLVLWYELNDLPSLTIADRSGNTLHGTISFPAMYADLTTTEGALQPVETVEFLDTGITTPDVAEAVGEPSGMFGGGEGTGLWFVDGLLAPAVAGLGTTPAEVGAILRLFLVIIALATIFLGGGAAVVFLKSAFGGVVAMAFITFIWTQMGGGILPFWALLFYIPIAIVGGFIDARRVMGA